MPHRSEMAAYVERGEIAPHIFSPVTTWRYETPSTQLTEQITTRADLMKWRREMYCPYRE
jgi:hypothetical protein